MDQFFNLGSSFYHVRCTARVDTRPYSLLSLIERHGFIPHLYADDTQILGFWRLSQDLLTRMSACIDEVAAWMRSNRLQLNTAESEFLWSTTSHRLHQLPQLPLRVGSVHISPASAVRDLGIYIHSDVSMRSHVAKTVSACYSILHQLRERNYEIS